MRSTPRSSVRAPRRALIGWALGLAFAFPALPAAAHGGKAGEVEIEHPYAPPSPPGAANGVAYIAGMVNGGKVPDRLLRVGTTVAQRTEIHTMAVDANGVMRMREAGEIVLPPGEKVEMKPGMGLHIMLIGLKQPLKKGDRFPLSMEFERGGKAEVDVIVQAPKAGGGAGGHEGHMH